MEESGAWTKIAPGVWMSKSKRLTGRGRSDKYEDKFKRALEEFKKEKGLQ